MGVGEADFAVGGLGSDTFFIGNDNLLDPEKGGEVWYVGNGDEDYLTIQGFDPYKDFLFGAGNFEDYTFEVIDGVDDIFGRTVPYKSLEVNYKGDRVALIEKIDGSLTLPDITSLIAFPLSEVGEERPNGLALVASQNQFLPPEPPAGSEYWNEAFYLAVFPEVAELVANGEYESALDYYIQVGQFLTEKDGGEKEGYFTGTKGNDIIQGFGVDNDLHGTEIADVTFDPSTSNVSVTLGSTGVSEIDVLVGTDKTNGFYAGGTWTKYNTEDFTGESTPYYRGGGDKDYSLVKNYQPDKDYVYFAGSAADYQYQSVDGNFKVYTADGDLVTIIEGVSDLVVTDLNSLGGFYMTGYEFGNHGEGEEPKFRGFNEDIYLLDNPGVAKLIENGIFTSPLDYYVKVGQYADTDVNNEKGKPVKGIFSGTDGNDYVIGFGQNGYNLSGVPLSVDLGTGTNRPIVFETLGEGEIDTLIGTKGIANGFLLGSFPTSANNTPQPFYVGGGDDDYAVIKNFESGESLSMAGKPEDYNFEKTETGINVSYKGDLVAKVEGVESLQVSSVISPDVFVVSSYPGVENFNEDVFGSGDELLGGAGNDRFFVQTGGDNTLIGGMGADQFWIASSENPEFVNTIVDFTLGEDVLGIAGLGASFETLTLTQQEDNTLIAFNNNELAILNGIQASSLSTENFAFV
ncbi:hypothetical protein HC931_07790 [Candidatus Gracilibacteria bacterium]|nr:hypothetical protein [Candidatus Gracilibacteria bacterium]